MIFDIEFDSRREKKKSVKREDNIILKSASRDGKKPPSLQAALCCRSQAGAATKLIDHSVPHLAGRQRIVEAG
ncbi:hypothetical protein HA466_0239650 [Hirschfeldia incana]|nr:hypothetical protein HA466_0239650 [Hirschfeldia incana]